MKFDKAYNVMKNGEEQHGIQQCIGTWIKMEKLNKITMEWVAKC